MLHFCRDLPHGVPTATRNAIFHNEARMTSAIELASYKEALILLGTAGVVVPIVHRLRISPILGFLAAGALLGPHLLGALAARLPLLTYVTVQDGKDIAWLGELGVVFLLFVIGLELSPQRLMTMRRLVFGLGALQMLVAAAAIGFLAHKFGVAPRAAALIGLSLALSSTAIVIELMAAQDRLASSTGRAVFSVLLLQDLAVVPILFLVGAFGTQSDMPLAMGLGKALLQAVIVLAVIVALGLWLLRPLFRLVAATASHELFMATTLFVVLGSGVLSAAAGLSMALGAFVGGLLLAETEYRRAIEATIEPFKGLLLGVFFFSVGMQIDIAVLKQSPILILAMAAGLIGLKAALFVPLARWFGLSWPASLESALLLGPGGEFAFIIIGLAASSAIMDPAMAGQMLAVVTLTMVALPFLALAGRRIADVWRSPGAGCAGVVDPAGPERHQAGHRRRLWAGRHPGRGHARTPQRPPSRDGTGWPCGDRRPPQQPRRLLRRRQEPAVSRDLRCAPS